MRTLRALYRHGWQRRSPHGVMSWRFLLPSRDPQLRLHRHWWLRSVPRLPRAIWLLLECWLYLRWALFIGWRACWRVWRGKSAEAVCVDGIAPMIFGWRLLRLALGSCIPPTDAWRLRLYRNGGHVRRWQYVYASETASFHDHCNRGTPAASEAARGLADKLGLYQRLRDIDVPLAEVCGVVAAGTAEPDWQRWPTRLFLKPRFGSGSRACFIRAADGASVNWRHFLPRDNRPPLEAWRRQSADSDYLVMPCYGRPARLSELSAGDQAVTLRVITCTGGEDIGPLCALLELARPDRGFRKVRLDLSSGRPLTVPDPQQAAAWEAAAEYLQCLVSAAVVSAIRAHRHAAPEYRAIAWDFLLTDDQPLLLEGNSHWDLAPIQQQAGLLSPAHDIGARLLYEVQA